VNEDGKRRQHLPAAITATLVHATCGIARARDSSRITSVTLYPGSATVERTARVTPGMTRLEIPRLPALNCAIAYPRDAAVAGLP